MSKTSRRLLLTGVVVFIVAIVASFPARVAYRWFAPDTVLLSGIDGTVWSGQAAAADIAGIPMSDLQWQWRPLALFRGGFGVHLEARPAGGTLTGDVVLGMTGNIALSNIKGVVNLGSVEGLIGIPGVRGIARADFATLTFADGVPDKADGILEVSNLLLPAVADQSIGGYKTEWFNQEDGLVGVIEDTNGSLDIAGRLLLKSDRSYSLLAQVAAKADTPTSVRRNLNTLGPANERGQRELRLEGVL